MNPEHCRVCGQFVDPLDPEYVVWDIQRWHVTCALKHLAREVDGLKEKMNRHDTTAANYSTLQIKIDDLQDAATAFLQQLEELPERRQQYGQIYMKNKNLVKREPDGKLMAGETDPRTTLQHETRPRQLISKG